MATSTAGKPDSSPSPAAQQDGDGHIDHSRLIDLMFDDEYLKKRGVERTKNSTGFMHKKITDELEQWISSNPDSKLPLLDAGAAFGFQTLHALKSGRNIWALDAEERHLSILRERAEELASSDEASAYGRLVRTTVARLPNREAVPPESVSGILMSEMLHFLKPGEPEQVFCDAATWLEPGGKLVVAVGSSAPRLASGVKGGHFTLPHGRSVEEALAVLKGPEEELLASPPAYVEISSDSRIRQVMGTHFYLMSTEELEVFSRRAGLEVERLEYCYTGKYSRNPEEPETTILVARKPL